MIILFGLFSYLFGSIPSGYIIFRIAEHNDIRHFGSQSTGATNVLRLKGWKYALPVILMDLAKGFLPVYLASQISPNKNIAFISAFFAVLGHCFPVYIRFKGGKGVATTVGAFALLSLKPLLMSLSLFVIVIVISRYVSLGSIMAALSFPLFILLFEGEKNLVLLSVAIFCIIILRHFSNIQRLIAGKERKFGQKERK